ncbi:hypothetical protein ACFOEW_19375 [Alteromonas oceani]|uniref:Uncharacterized protein n=1 Tax=Alteromonas oceani TaxID=2071609 RepID=A0ABV7K3N1_9ALTE|nr:hypothetical protein [Alteromonas oceani]
MNKLLIKAKSMVLEMLPTIILMIGVVALTHYLNTEQQQALTDVLRQFELLKLKASMAMG